MAINQAFGWTWILGGLLFGLLLGLRFREEGWLGGYGSHRRRLLRLAHVSFVGLGILNVLFALSAAGLRLPPFPFFLASSALILGAVSMPACCALMAWRPALQPIFALPVLSLTIGVALTVAGMLRP